MTTFYTINLKNINKPSEIEKHLLQHGIRHYLYTVRGVVNINGTLVFCDLWDGRGSNNQPGASVDCLSRKLEGLSGWSIEYKSFQAKNWRGTCLKNNIKNPVKDNVIVEITDITSEVENYAKTHDAKLVKQLLDAKEYEHIHRNPIISPLTPVKKKKNDPTKNKMEELFDPA